MGLFFFVSPVFAQLHDNTWIFGHTGHGPLIGHSKFTFYTGSLKIDTLAYFGLEYAFNNSALSDTGGNFIASFSGDHILNKNYALMENGGRLNKEIIKDHYYLSSTDLPQGSVMLPWPDHPDSILLLYGSWILFTPNGWADITSFGVNMAVIDAKANNGLGKVVSRDNQFIEDTIQIGRLNPVRHANGRDWWLLVSERERNRFYTILIDPKGPKIVGKQVIGFPLGDGLDQGAFSPDGSKYVIHNGVDFNATGVSFNVYDFDRCSGRLSNHKQYFMKGNFGGTAISPSGRYAYQNVRDTAFQYDLEGPDIWASRQVVAIYDGFKGPVQTSLYQMQLAADGKIYSCATNGVLYMHVIHSPDEPGLACQYQQHGIKLSKYNSFSVPNFPNYRLGPLDGSPCDTLGLNNVPVAWYRYQQDTLEPLLVDFHDLSHHEPANWHWDFGDPASGASNTATERHPRHLYTAPGKYEACLTVRNPYGTHTHCKTLFLGVTPSENPVLQEQVQVWPNPFGERLAIAFSATNLRQPVFLLYDATGSLVRQEHLSFGIHEVDTGDLSKGMYFWVVESAGERVKSGKVVKL